MLLWYSYYCVLDELFGCGYFDVRREIRVAYTRYTTQSRVTAEIIYAAERSLSCFLLTTLIVTLFDPHDA